MNRKERRDRKERSAGILPAPIADLNMTREYKAELKQLRFDLRTLDRADKSDHRAYQRADAQINRELRARQSALARDHRRTHNVAHKTRQQIARRIAVLEGRLS